MYGLEAISHNNGWAIAFVGITIVFTCLTLLSLTLSQLHKVLGLWDKRKDIVQGIKEKKEQKANLADSLKKSDVQVNLEDAARQFNILIKTMNDPFSLPELIDLAKKRGLNRPHSTVNAMLKVKLIIPDEKGYYHWDEQIYENIIRKGRG